MMQTIIPDHILTRLVHDADRAALETVKKGHGGPFGAILALYDTKTQKLLRIGEPAANEVLETGLGSAHAEDRVLRPELFTRLKDLLKKADPAQTYVLVGSSAESCPACHAKLEIAARILLSEKLIRPGHFIVAFGADYDDTHKIAGFNDAPYHADLLPRKMITIIPAMEPENMPPVVFPDGDAALAADTDGRMAIGRDQSNNDFTALPEVQAIRNLCAIRKKEGLEEPWNCNGGTLYTHMRDIGPLIYAECQWANITKIVILPDHRDINEAPDCTNTQLLYAVANRPYNGSGTAIHVVQARNFENQAQLYWRDAGQLKTYNGVT